MRSKYNFIKEKAMKRISGWIAALIMTIASVLFLSACKEDEGVGDQQTLPEISEISDLTDDRYINLYGRNFYSDNLEGMRFVNSASGFEVHFRGTSLSMCTRVITTGGNFNKSMFSVFVDGNTDSTARIVSVQEYLGGFRDQILVEGLEQGEHTVKVLKRTPSNKDSCIVESVATDGVFLAAPAKPEIRLDVYGDSITCGEGILREVTYDEMTGKYTDSGTYTADTQNVFQAYAGVAARELNAEFRVFGRGGIALNYSTETYNVLNNYKSMAVDLTVGRDCPEYDYSSWTPSAVVLYLGTNDYNFGRKYAQLNYSSEGMRDAVVRFVREVVGENYGKEMPVFLCAGMMVPDSGLDTIMEQAKRILDFEFPNIRTVIFDACAIGHPVVSENETAGLQLAASIKDVLGLN